MRPLRPAVALPSPRIAFGSDFLPRLGRLVARLAAAAGRREGAGRTHRFGAGTEFVGYRPYRSGEDPRQLDWNLYARLRRPYVRVTRCEASEHWAILLDTSASMGVGVPGKLQRAAEVAIALASSGLRAGAAVDLHASSGRTRLHGLRRPAGLAAWMAALEAERAQGGAGIAALLGEAGRVRGAGRVFLVGDLLDVPPSEARRLARVGRELFFVQLLAPEELSPSTGGGADGGPLSEGPVRWIDPESGDERTLFVDRRARGAYEHLLAAELEAWGAIAARHRAAYGCWSPASSFEEIVQGLFGG
ncbi:MAG: DUF58 domain-containing protein [Planctomycetota bacterium]